MPKKTNTFSALIAEFLVGIIGGFLVGLIGFFLAASLDQSISITIDITIFQGLNFKAALAIALGEAVGATIGVYSVCKLVEAKGITKKSFLGALSGGLISIILVRTLGLDLLFSIFLLPSFGAVIGYNFGDTNPYSERAS